MADQFTTTCLLTIGRLRTLLPHAEAIDQGLEELMIPPPPKRRRNGYTGADLDAATIFEALSPLSDNLVERMNGAIAELEDARESRAEQERASQLARLQEVQVEVDTLRRALGLTDDTTAGA